MTTAPRSPSNLTATSSLPEAVKTPPTWTLLSCAHYGRKSGYQLGTDGKVTTPIGSINDSASAVAIQSDGKIVLAGRSQTASDNDFALARYDSDTTVLIVDAGEDQEGDEATNSASPVPSESRSAWLPK